MAPAVIAIPSLPLIKAIALSPPWIELYLSKLWGENKQNSKWMHSPVKPKTQIKERSSTRAFSS